MVLFTQVSSSTKTTGDDTTVTLLNINASANTIKTKIENTKTVYTSVTKQQLAETKIQMFCLGI
jgi:hypothetical protein